MKPVMEKVNDEFVEFAKGGDILIHDAQYSHDEYNKDKVGWGHSSIQQALDNSLRASAKKVLLTHHDPCRDDADIDKLYKEYKKKEKYKSLDFEFAREGYVYV